MRQKTVLLAAVLALLSACASQGAVISSISIRDREKTMEPSLKVTVRGKIAQARINGIPVPAEGGSVEFGLLLNPGKNFVRIEAWDRNGNYQHASRRVLRIISFPDVEMLYNNRPHWAKTEIVTLATLGMVEGFPDDRYYISNATTRGEFASWLCKAKGYRVSPPDSDMFLDVPREHWRAPYVYEVVRRGLMRGDDAGLFGIEAPISRGEAAFTSLKAEGAAFEREIISAFYDVPSTHPFYNQIKLARTSGLIKGVSWKTAIFEPERELTRAEAAILLSRFRNVRQATRALYSFDTGYDNTAYCRINTAPRIIDLQVSPGQIIVNRGTPVTLRAIVESREGFEDLISVSADISRLNGPPDAAMYDDGTRGDPKGGDGEYYLQFMATPEATGEIVITATATDRQGWRGSREVRLFSVK